VPAGSGPRGVTELPGAIARRIGPFYVYALVDPRDDSIFYVGKGTGRRLLSHGREAQRVRVGGGSTARAARIRAIRAAGFETRVDVIRHGLDERSALRVEAALIDVLPGLTNAVAGHDTTAGRQPLDVLVRRYGAKPIPKHAPPALLIRLGPWTPGATPMPGGRIRNGHGYYAGMPDEALADSLRGWWRLSPDRVRRLDIQHAVAVHEGVTVGVVKIGEWHRRDDGRWAFEDLPASARVRHAWLGDVGRNLPTSASAQNPVRYWTAAEHEHE